MTETSAKFKAKSTVKSADLEHRQKINFNIARYNAIVPQGKHQFSDLTIARERAKNIKWRALETLDQQLEEFELQLTRRQPLMAISAKYLISLMARNFHTTILLM